MILAHVTSIFLRVYCLWAALWRHVIHHNKHGDRREGPLAQSQVAQTLRQHHGQHEETGPRYQTQGLQTRHTTRHCLEIRSNGEQRRKTLSIMNLVAMVGFLWSLIKVYKGGTFIEAWYDNFLYEIIEYLQYP